MQSTLLRPVDAAWLRMDSPVNPMIITSVLTLEGAVPYETLANLVSQRLASRERFQMRVADSGLPLVLPRWERDPHFDVRSHLHHLRLPAPGGEQALEGLIADLMSARLDRARPLWQIYAIDDAPGGTAIVTRFHHCLADGISLVQLLLELCDDAAGNRAAVVGLSRADSDGSMRALSARAASFATTLGRLLMLPSDPASPLRGTLGVQKSAVRLTSVPVEPLKTRAKQLGGTLNDVVATVIAAGLHGYLRTHGCATEGLTLRALVPMFLRDDAGSGLGNHFGLVFLDLPVDEGPFADRFVAVKRNMDQIKTQDDATVAFAVLDAIGMASHDLEHLFLEVFSRKASIMTSNVPGPERTVHLAGYPVRDISVWAPVSGYLGVSVTAFSYAGQLRLSVYCDASLVREPALLRSALDEAMREALGER